MDVLFIEPYCSGSHRAFCEGFVQHSQHDIQLRTMPGRRWQQRMRGGSVRMAQRLQGDRPDVILASDFLDLAAFKATCTPSVAELPCVMYFHENQLTYPLRDGQKREFEFAHTNVVSALAADQVVFNSNYHRHSFLDACDSLYPKGDNTPHDIAESIDNKSRVIPVGVDLKSIDDVRNGGSHNPGAVTILWNHRWEYDKAPGTFFDVMERLDADGLDFEIAMAGQSFARKPPAFERAQQRLSHRFKVFGTVTARSDYLQLLVASDIIVSTAIHEFFGISVVEAMYAGCAPLLPNRLSYPELLPRQRHEDCLYRGEEDLYQRLTTWINDPSQPRSIDLKGAMARFKWKKVAPQLDATLSTLCHV